LIYGSIQIRYFLPFTSLYVCCNPSPPVIFRM
jgi:hypothetical protein